MIRKWYDRYLTGLTVLTFGPPALLAIGAPFVLLFGPAEWLTAPVTPDMAVSLLRWFGLVALWVISLIAGLFVDDAEAAA